MSDEYRMSEPLTNHDTIHTKIIMLEKELTTPKSREHKLLEIARSSLRFFENDAANCDEECAELHEEDDTCRHDDFIFKTRQVLSELGVEL